VCGFCFPGPACITLVDFFTSVAFFTKFLAAANLLGNRW